MEKLVVGELIWDYSMGDMLIYVGKGRDGAGVTIHIEEVDNIRVSGCEAFCKLIDTSVAKFKPACLTSNIGLSSLESTGRVLNKIQLLCMLRQLEVAGNEFYSEEDFECLKIQVLQSMTENVYDEVVRYAHVNSECLNDVKDNPLDEWQK